VLDFSTASPPCSPCPSSSPSPNFADPVPDQTNLINTEEILGGGRENKRERERGRGGREQRWRTGKGEDPGASISDQAAALAQAPRIASARSGRRL
jgi:hypothetical protein